MWYVLDFENDIDPELPLVVRPTFSPYPPAAYRFAEACDTIDHVAVYVSSAALVLAAWGWFRNLREPFWAGGGGFVGGRFLARGHAGPAGRRLVWPGLANHLRFARSAANRLLLAGLAASVAAIVVRALLERPFRLAWNGGSHAMGSSAC